jgi:hypothetical protein
MVFENRILERKDASIRTGTCPTCKGTVRFTHCWHTGNISAEWAPQRLRAKPRTKTEKEFEKKLPGGELPVYDCKPMGEPSTELLHMKFEMPPSRKAEFSEVSLELKKEC